MKIEVEKSYIVKMSHKERRTIMNALTYTADKNVDKEECEQILDQFIRHNKGE